MLGRSNHNMLSIVVVFPAPFGPINAKILPLGTEKVTSCRRVIFFLCVEETVTDTDWRSMIVSRIGRKYVRIKQVFRIIALQVVGR